MEPRGGNYLRRPLISLLTRPNALLNGTPNVELYFDRPFAHVLARSLMVSRFMGRLLNVAGQTSMEVTLLKGLLNKQACYTCVSPVFGLKLACLLRICVLCCVVHVPACATHVLKLACASTSKLTSGT